MLLVGERVRLDRLTEADIPTLMAWDRDLENVRSQLSNVAMPATVETWRQRIAKDHAATNAFGFAVRRHEDDALVGEVSLAGITWHQGHGRLGLSIAREHQNRGLGTEALGLILAFAFDEVNLHRVELGVFSFNTGAIRLYERQGFVHEGRLREWGRRNGAWFDLVNMAMLESEYRART